MGRRILIIANPIAGGGRAEVRARELAEALGDHGIAGEPYFTRAAGDARRRAAAMATDAEPWDGVVSVGGDGTMNEVLNGLPALDLPFGVLAGGTANVLAKELRLPKKPARLARLIADDSLAEIAVGTANGRRFLLFVGVGMDGAIVRRLEQVRSGTLGKHKWIGPVWHVISTWPAFGLEVRCADGAAAGVRTGLTEVLVTRVRNYGGVMRLPRGIAIDDGQLHVLCFRQRTRRSWAAAILRALFGRLRRDRDVDAFTARRLTIAPAGGSARVPYQIDGDLGGDAPVAVELLDRPVRLFRPL